MSQSLQLGLNRAEAAGQYRHGKGKPQVEGSQKSYLRTVSAKFALALEIHFFKLSISYTNRASGKAFKTSYVPGQVEAQLH
jgi:hypothetical protein